MPDVTRLLDADAAGDPTAAAVVGTIPAESLVVADGGIADECGAANSEAGSRETGLAPYCGRE